MDEKERKELIETIKTRVSVWAEQTYVFCDNYPKVQLTNGNVFEVQKLYIERHDVYDDVMVSLYDDLIGSVECYLQHLTDESLVKIAEELPLTHTIFVTFHPTYKESFVILAQPVRANFDDDDFDKWLSKNFPLLDWEPYDDDYICYTESTDTTDIYLYATLQASE